MAILNKNKVFHLLRLNDGTEIELYVVTDYDFGSNYSIINYEAATGDGGLSFNNGRTVEEVPISGTLLGSSFQDIKTKATKIRKFADRKEVVEFIYPYKADLRSNKFFIKDIRISPQQGRDTEVNFNLTLTEKREANVRTTQVNIVNFAPAELYKQILQQQTEGTV